MQSDLFYRRAAVDAAMAHHCGRALEFGRHDCVRLAVSVIKALGHKISLAKGGDYRSFKGAVAALKRAGHPSLEAALDEKFARIPPAAAWPGDIIALPGETWPALTVALGNGRVLGFYDGRCQVLDPLVFVDAWRVPYMGKRN